MDPGWVLAAISLATVVTGLAGWFCRWLWKLAAKTSRFLDDYNGEPATQGRAERPGVMARLERLEQMTEGISAQVHLNSGHSMRDEVQTISRDVADLQHSVAELAGRKQNGGSGGN